MQTPVLRRKLPSTQDYPLVGVALLHSLLAHEDIQRHDVSMNATLDFLALIQNGASASTVVRAFYQLRRSCEKLAFLPVFKIRRWLESQLELRVDGELMEPVRLGFASYQDLKRFYQNQVWEFSELDDAPGNHWVRFHWKS